MALKGTIQDFGIADIFQLISQQRKTGILILSDDNDDVRVHFQDGAVVRAESSTRPKQMLVGSMLLQAGLVSQHQLNEALKVQGRTLRRLGAVLLDMKVVDQETIAEFAKLQMTETLYRLFLWKAGTYEFEPTDVDPPADGVPPIEAEHILMEGVRVMDEWPRVKRGLPGPGALLEQAKPIPIVPVEGEGGAIGAAERKLWAMLATPATVGQLVGRSRLGEFETQRAVHTLLGGGYVRVRHDPDKASEPSKAPSLLTQVKPTHVLARVLVYLALAGGALVLARSFDASWYGQAWGGTVRPRPSVAHRYLARAQMRALRRALEVYRLERGRYPDRLERLVTEGLVAERDLRHPFERPYEYELKDGRPRLLPPLY